MIEIAISLAVIGLRWSPSSASAHRAGRPEAEKEETIINQDASIWVETLRNGVQARTT